jgi:hypothetical protein
MLAEKSIPYYFEPVPSVQYNGISHRLSEQCGSRTLDREDTPVMRRELCMGRAENHGLGREL